MATRIYSPENLLAPSGVLDPAMWPGVSSDEVTEMLEAYLDDGYKKAADAVNVDEAALAWAYYRAFSARALKLANIASTVNVPNETSQIRTDAQRDYVAKQAEIWKDTFYGYFPAQTIADAFPPSGTSRTHFGWGGTL